MLETESLATPYFSLRFATFLRNFVYAANFPNSIEFLPFLNETVYSREKLQKKKPCLVDRTNSEEILWKSVMVKFDEGFLSTFYKNLFYLVPTLWI